MSMRNLAFHEIARNPYESAAPELWPAHAWIPALGIQGGVLFDVAGGLHGTVYGSSWGIENLSFSTTSDYVEAGILPVFNDQITCFTRFRLNSYSGNQFPVGNYTSAGKSFFYRIDTLGRHRVRFHNGTSFTDTGLKTIGTTTAIQDNAIVHNGAQYRIFYGGAFSDSDNFALGTTQHTAKARFGLISFSQLTPMSGSIYQCYIYHKALADGQIQALSSDPLLPFRRREITPYFFVPASGGTTVALSGAAAESVTEATPGTITVNQVIPVTLSGIASESTAEATPGSAVSGSTISQAIEGAASISSSDAVAGSATVNQVIPMALAGAASVSESTASAGTITVNQVIAQTISGAASLSGGTATPGNVIAGEVVSQSLSGAVSESTAGATAGTITVEQVVSGALSGTLSVSESPAQVGTLTLGIILSGEPAISEVFAVPGRENHEGFYEPQELTGAVSVSQSEASAGIAYWGKEIGPYSASRIEVISARYQAILRSQKYNATRR
jgi:hypothetical protein